MTSQIKSKPFSCTISDACSPSAALRRAIGQVLCVASIAYRDMRDPDGQRGAVIHIERVIRAQARLSDPAVSPLDRLAEADFLTGLITRLVDDGNIAPGPNTVATIAAHLRALAA